MPMKPITKYSRNHKNQGGFTIIETLTALTISAAILVGLAVSAVSVMYHYRDDWVIIELNNYGNLMLQEITDRMENATNIKVSRIADNYAIELTDENGRQSYITSDENEGFTQDNFPLLRGVSLPASGLYRKADHRIVKQINFDCYDLKTEGIKMPYPGGTHFQESAFYLTFTLSLETSYQDNLEPQTEYFIFTRRVFSSKKYLKSQGVSVANAPGSP